MNDEIIPDKVNISSSRPLNDDSPRDHVTSNDHEMTDHTEYDYVDEITMDRGIEDYEGIYMTACDMDSSEKQTNNEYIDIIDEPSRNVYEITVQHAKEDTESECVERYATLSSPVCQEQMPAGNNHDRVTGMCKPVKSYRFSFDESYLHSFSSVRDDMFWF